MTRIVPALNAVKAGQLWLAPIAKKPLRVMAVAEGYAMVRHTGGEPFTLSTNMMVKLYERVT